MKKIIHVVTVALLGTIALTSCSKKGDYTCTCTISGTAQAAVPYNDFKKSDAESACDQLRAAAKMSDPANDCTFK